MKRWMLSIGIVLTAYAAVTEQAAFRGSLGINSTSNYLVTDYGNVDPTKNGLAFGAAMGYRFASGFLFELDFISSSNSYTTNTLNDACLGGACSYVACSNNFATNPPTTTCTGTNMAAPASTTGGTVNLSGTTPTAGSATSSAATTSSSTSGTVTTTTTIIDYTGTSYSITDATSGYVSSSSLMLNAIYQFSPEYELNPYIGYGLGFAQTKAGISITTTPTNTTVQTTTVSSLDTSDNNTTTTTYNTYMSSVKADQATQTLTKTNNSGAFQVIFGSEIKFDMHNTLDLRMVKRYINIPNVTTLVPTGTPYPSIGINTTTNGVTTTTVNNISAYTTTFEVGLLYYG